MMMKMRMIIMKKMMKKKKSKHVSFGDCNVRFSHCVRKGHFEKL